MEAFQPEVLQVDEHHGFFLSGQFQQAGFENLGESRAFRAQGAASTQELNHGLLEQLSFSARLPSVVGADQPELFLVFDVESLPESGERPHIVGVQTRQGATGRRAHGLAGTAVELELGDVHAAEPMLAHACPDVMGDRPEVLTDDGGFVAFRLQSEDGIELVGMVSDVSTFGRREAFRNPVKPMQVHDVVDTEHTRIPHVLAQTVNVVTVSVAANHFRMNGGETPVLAVAEEAVGRSASCDARGE